MPGRKRLPDAVELIELARVPYMLVLKLYFDFCIYLGRKHKEIKEHKIGDKNLFVPRCSEI